MKPITPLLLGILGLTALFSSPAAAQTNVFENFFNGVPPYNGENITGPLNSDQQRGTFRDRDQETPASADDATRSTNGLRDQNNPRNQSEDESNRNNDSINQEQNDISQ